MTTRLSRFIAELKDRYGVIVVGSGYGGSITAARLAAAGYEVCILERGREWGVGEFPDRLEQVIAQVRRDGNPLGLYDYRITRDIDVLIGCGLGGTSLINANVVMRPDPDIFDHPRWPEEVRADRDKGTLDEYYEKVASMLGVSPLPDDGPSLRKMEAHKTSAQGRPGRFQKLDLTVNFDRYDDGPNHVGVTQRRCILCGDCVTGCNAAAKNTLPMNYLPFAKDHGAFIFTGMEVDYISTATGGGYFVHCTCHKEDKKQAEFKVLHGSVVILAAGSFGSTQILMNSRDRGLVTSDRLGHYFSTNADTLGIGYNDDVRTDILGFGTEKDNRSEMRVGPTIVSVIDYRKQKPLKDRFIIEEGAIPRAFLDTLRYVLPKISAISGHDTDFGVIDELSEAGRIIRDLARYDPKGALNHSMVYLGMGHDGAEGVLALDPESRIRIHWETAPTKPILEKIDDEMKQLTSALGGTYIKNPRWSPFFGRSVVTVHPLGGCAMGRSHDEGVVDHRGRVFDPSQGGTDAVHEGLLVADGSILPTSLGVNPLLTISALSERIADLLIQDPTVNKEPREGDLPPAPDIRPAVGMEFTEEMKGYITESVKDARTPEQYREAEERGKGEGTTLDFTLTIYIDNVDRFVTEPAHEARAEGYVTMGPSKHVVERGRFQLFIKDPQTETRRMRYSLQFYGDEDQCYLLEGYKEIKDDPALDFREIWRDSTTLFTTLYKGDTTNAPVFGQGIVRIDPRNLLEQLTTFRVRNAANAGEKAKALAQFMSFFFGELWETYLKQLLPGE